MAEVLNITMRKYIAASHRNKNYGKSINYFEQMRIVGFVPDEVVCRNIIKFHIYLGNHDKALSILDFMKDAGLQPPASVYNLLIKAIGVKGKFSSSNDMEISNLVTQVRTLLKRMINDGIRLDEEAYCSALIAYDNIGASKESLELLRIMKILGIRCNKHIYNSVLSSLRNTGNIKSALLLLDEMFANSVEVDAKHIYNVIYVCRKNGNFDIAYKVMEKMEARGIKPDEKIFEGLIMTCTIGNKSEMVLGLINEMIGKGMYPSIWTFNIAINIFQQQRPIVHLESIFYLLEKMRACNISPDMITYTSIFDACSKANKWQPRILELLIEMESDGLSPDVKCYTAILHGCAKFSKISLLYEILRKMEERKLKPNLVCFNMILFGLTKSGEYHEVLRFLKLMLNMKVEPDQNTITSCIKSCSIASDWDTALAIFNLIDFRKDGDDNNYYICYVDIINAAIRNNRHKEAEKLNKQFLKYMKEKLNDKNSEIDKKKILWALKALKNLNITTGRTSLVEDEVV